MLSPRDIADLEQKYSKYIFKKRAKIFFYILFVFLVIASIFYYFLSSGNYIKNLLFETKIETTKIKKADNIIKTQSSTTKKIQDVIKSKETTPQKIEKTEDKNQDKNLSKVAVQVEKPKIDNNVTSKRVVEPIIKKRDEHNSPKKELQQKKSNKKNPLHFQLLPSERVATNNTNRRELKFNSPINIKKGTPSSNTPRKTVKTMNKNDTMVDRIDKKPKINIKMRDIDSIQYLKNKFEKTHDIVFALMLCESYYSQRDYKNSLKWSIIANDIDSSSERSWIWFAKSKYRLHQKNDAIRALKSFLKANNSQNVKSLLRDIINGELNE